MTNAKNLYHVNTVEEFENGYWYVAELEDYARSIGVSNAGKFRKDQLEKVIKHYIESGFDSSVLQTCEGKKAIVKTQSKRDSLELNTAIENYVSNRETKAFILAEARKLCPNLPGKSGVWYWLNRWRETQRQNNQKVTYQNLVDHFVELSTKEGRLPQIPSARFNNFVTDYLAANEGGREQAIEAWEHLKTLDIPKTFAAWRNHMK